MFNWTDAATQAAQMVAEGEISYEAIASVVGVTSRTLRNWRSDEDFTKRVEEIREESRQFVMQRGIAAREKRIAAYNDRWRRMQSVIDARAADALLAGVPGGDTGLVTRLDVKGVGKGDDFTLISVYGVDTGLLREMRELEKQAAQDTGQWTEKRELTGRDGAPLAVSLEAAIDRIYGDGPAEGATDPVPGGPS